MLKKLAAGNWKMNGTSASLGEVEALIGGLFGPVCEVLICPPSTLIERVKARAAGSDLLVGGQDCHPETTGPHTGDISAAMLSDAGASHVILGHSERRSNHGETDELVWSKTKAAHEAELVAIVCVGETEDERGAGETLSVVRSQLSGSLPEGGAAGNTVIAYEPVWAIGTGRTPSGAEIEEVHAFMRAELAQRFGDEGSGIRLLYGGSVNPANAAEIFALSNVDGALVGGASLKARDFLQVINALGA